MNYTASRTVEHRLLRAAQRLGIYGGDLYADDAPTPKTQGDLDRIATLITAARLGDLSTADQSEAKRLATALVMSSKARSIDSLGGVHVYHSDGHGLVFKDAYHRNRFFMALGIASWDQSIRASEADIIANAMLSEGAPT